MPQEQVNQILNRIRSTRENMGIPQAEISEMLGFQSPVAYNLIENGHRKLTLEVFIGICRALDKSPEYFFGGDVRELSEEEIEIVDIYRALPDRSKRSGIMMLKGWLEQVRGKL